MLILHASNAFVSLSSMIHSLPVMVAFSFFDLADDNELAGKEGDIQTDLWHTSRSIAVRLPGWF